MAPAALRFQIRDFYFVFDPINSSVHTNNNINVMLIVLKITQKNNQLVFHIALPTSFQNLFEV